jgi:hypothetical protein
MKKLLLVLAIAGSPLVQAANLPTGWYPIGDQSVQRYTVEVEPDGGFSGAGLKVESKGDVTGNFGGVGQAISAANYAGKTVRLTGYLKTSAVTDGYAGLWFRVDKENGVQLLDNMSARGVTGTTDWQQYEAVLRVDQEATRIIFGALLTGSGVMYADEFALEVVPDSTPTTIIHSIPEEPANLGF